MALSPGTRLGSYEVTALIGQGGMGEVHRATDTQRNRQVGPMILAEALVLELAASRRAPLPRGAF